MRNTKCPFCNKVFNDKHDYCEHIVNQHNDQIPEDCEIPLEFAYSLLVHKNMGRVCVMCRKNQVHFNQNTLKYERLCDDPKCKEAYVKSMKNNMKNVYGKEHLLNESEMQRKMIYNHALARDYVWDDKHTFRIIGSYEEDFLNKLKSLNWSPDDIIAPSPNTYTYKWKDGTVHLYIPDFFLPSLSLEVEIKENTNKSSRMEHSREIEYLKDKQMERECAKSGIHYIKIVEKNYDEFIEDYIESDHNAPE